MKNKNTIYDLREPYWGHNVNMINKNPLTVMGCLTPLPVIGDYLINNERRFNKIIEITYENNPKDLFTAILDITDVVLTEEELVPSWEEVENFYRSNLEGK